MIIHYASRFVRRFKALPQEIQLLAIKQEKIFKANSNDPRLHAKFLSGKLKDVMSFRVTRNYRVLYAWKDKQNIVFYDIGDRKVIYR